MSGAVRYQGEKLMVAFGVESINQAQPAADKADLDDSFSWNLGGNYQAGWAKLYAYAQVFENYAAAAKVTTFSLPSGVDGYGAIVGADVPVMGATVKMAFGYGDFEGSRNSNLSMKTYQTAIGLTYPLSRRTTVYTGGNWIKSDYSKDYEASHASAIDNIYEFTAGIVHKF